jgi:hypothetical protein
MNPLTRTDVKRIHSTVLRLLACMLIVVFISGCAGTTVRQGGYTLHRSAAPRTWVTGIAASKLVRADFPGMTIANERFLGRVGREMTLTREADGQVVKFILAVYGTTAEAEDTALATLKYADVTLPSGSKSHKTIGTHSWYEVGPNGSGVILAVYYNVLFRISSANYELAEEQALKIVKDLKKGRHGVRLGRKVKPPKAKIPELKLARRSDGLWMMSRRPVSPESKVTYRVSSSQGHMLRVGEDGRFLYRPSRSGSVTFTVYAIDDMNVVSKAYKEKKKVK